MSPASTAWFRRWAPWLILLVIAAASAGRASASREIGGDFLRYHRAGRLVAEGRAEEIYSEELLQAQSVYAAEREAEREAHGEHADPLTERQFKYLPAVAVMFAPLGALPARTAWIVWGGWNGLMVGLTFLAAWRVAAPVTSARWLLLVVLALLHLANQNLKLGQLNPTAIAPATLAIWALVRGKDRLAGVLAGFGGAVKFLPASLAIWFLWKRRSGAALTTVVAMAVFAWALPAAVLGPERATRLTQEYFELRTAVYATEAPPDVPGQSVKSLVYRTLGGVPFQTGPKHNDVREFVRDVSVAHLPPAVLKWLVVGICVILLWVVLLPAWGPLRTAVDPRGPPEAGLFFCWMLLASPEARSPHFLYLALPVSALVVGVVHAWRERLPGHRLAAALTVIGCLLLQTDSGRVVGDELQVTFEAWCAVGFGTGALLVALLLVHRPEA